MLCFILKVSTINVHLSELKWALKLLIDPTSVFARKSTKEIFVRSAEIVCFVDKVFLPSWSQNIFK